MTYDLTYDPVMVRFCFNLSCVSTTENSRNEMAKYAKNYLPLLFNVYTSEESKDLPDQQLVLDTIKDYLSVTDGQVLRIVHTILQYTTHVRRFMV